MTQQENVPNLFELSGKDLQITYSTSGFDGKPHLTYQDSEGERTFTGDEIRTQDLEIGLLVTVTLHIQVDVGGTKLSLLLPKVRLLAETEQPLKALAIKTQSTGNLVRAGATESYHTISLKGTAKLVFF
jgi:hypothetical protein